MPESFQHDVFLSHNKADKPRVRKLAERLRAAGIRVWFDEWAIKPGDDIYLAIERGLGATRTLILCLSQAALQSDWVGLERSTVLFRDPSNAKRRFVPLLLADCKLPDTLQRYKYVDFRQDADAAFEELLAFCRGEESLPLQTPTTSPLLKSKIDDARLAARKHDEENAIRLWQEVGKEAEKESNKAAEIGARLEVVMLQLRCGADLDDALSVLDKCIQEAKSVDLGDDRSRLFQLLGEAHRLKGNFDQARGFITRALEHSRSLGYKLDEGWALLALSALGKAAGESAEGRSGMGLIQQAYDCFSAIYATGEKEKQRLAKEGFAACHSWRARVFRHHRLDDAMAEYARSLEVFLEMGDDYEWDVADILFQRGELHAIADDPQLAAKDLEAASKLFKKLGDHIKEAECVLRIAELLDKRGLRLESAQYYQAAAAITMQQKNRKRSAWIWFRYACKMAELREFDEATSIFSTLLKAEGFTSGQRLDVLKNLCLIAKATGQKDDLERYSQAALEIIDEKISNAKSADARRKLIISKAKALEELDEHDRAVACLQRAIEGFESVNDVQGISECWFHIGGVMRATSKHKEEREAYERVLKLAGDNGDSFFLPMTLTMLAQLDISEKRFDEARKHLDVAEQKNQTLNNPVVLLIGQDLRRKLPPA